MASVPSKTKLAGTIRKFFGGEERDWPPAAVSSRIISGKQPNREEYSFMCATSSAATAAQPLQLVPAGVLPQDAGAASSSDLATAANAVPALVALLREGGNHQDDPKNDGAMYAAYTLSGLAAAGESALEAMRDAGAPSALVALLAEPGHAAATAAAAKGAMRALSRLARHTGMAHDIVAVGGLQAVVKLLESRPPPPDDEGLARRALILLYALAADRAPLQAAVCDSGAVPLLLELAASSSADVQAEAVDVLKVLARNPQCGQSVAALGGLDVLARVACTGATTRAKASATRALQRLHVLPELRAALEEASAANGQLLAAHAGSDSFRTPASPAPNATAGSMISPRPHAAGMAYDYNACSSSDALGVLMTAEPAAPNRARSMTPDYCSEHAELAPVQGLLDALLATPCSTDAAQQLSSARALLSMAAANVHVLDGVCNRPGELQQLLGQLQRGPRVLAAPLLRLLLLLAGSQAHQESLLRGGAVPVLLDVYRCSDAALSYDAACVMEALSEPAAKLLLQRSPASCSGAVLAASPKADADAADGAVLREGLPTSSRPTSPQRASMAASIALLKERRAAANLGGAAAAAAAAAAAPASDAPVSCMAAPKPRALLRTSSLDRGAVAMAVKKLEAGSAAVQQQQQQPSSSPRSRRAQGAAASTGQLCRTSSEGSHVPVIFDALAPLDELQLHVIQQQQQQQDQVNAPAASLQQVLHRLEKQALHDMQAHHHPPLQRQQQQQQLAKANTTTLQGVPAALGAARDGRRGPGSLTPIGTLQQQQQPKQQQQQQLVMMTPKTIAAKRSPSAPPPADGSDTTAAQPSQVVLHAAAAAAAVVLSPRKTVAPPLPPADASNGAAAAELQDGKQRIQQPQKSSNGADGAGLELSLECDEQLKGLGALLLKHDDITICRTSDGRKRKLGEGGFGVVYMGLMNACDEVAVKLVKAAHPSKRELELFRREVATLAKLHHRNIVQFYGACLEINSLFIVTELMKGGDLYTALRQHSSMMAWERLGRKVALDVALGLNYLHCQRPPMMHRDLKSPNVLLSEEGVAKIADVGMLRSQASSLVTAQPVMTPLWAAPEVVRHERASIKADIWSFGILIFEIASGEDITQFRPLSIKRQAGGDAHGRSMELPSRCPAVAQRLFAACTQTDPDKRPSAQELVEWLRADATGASG